MLRGIALAEIAEAVRSADMGDALGVSTAVAQKAKSRQVQKSSDRASWALASREKDEITCASLLWHWGEDIKKAAPPPEKKQKLDAAEVADKQRRAATASFSRGADSAIDARWDVVAANATTAIGPAMPDGTRAEFVPLEAKIFDILELDGTAQNRMSMYGTLVLLKLV
ncbi:unnamed protein product, partial [Polarella glacialis]